MAMKIRTIEKAYDVQMKTKKTTGQKMATR